MPITIDNTVTIPDDAIEERFVRSSGPGGQNVNKVATAVQLRIDLARAEIPPGALRRLRRLAGSQVDTKNILHLHSQTERTQERNRAIARQRLTEIVRQALVVPKMRRATRPSRSAKERRLAEKQKQGQRKLSRSRIDDLD